jgi:hypothetical protein
MLTNARAVPPLRQEGKRYFTNNEERHVQRDRKSPDQYRYQKLLPVLHLGPALPLAQRLGHMSAPFVGAPLPVVSGV